MTFAQRRNRLTTHLTERIPVVKRRMTVVLIESDREREREREVQKPEDARKRGGK